MFCCNRVNEGSIDKCVCSFIVFFKKRFRVHLSDLSLLTSWLLLSCAWTWVYFIKNGILPLPPIYRSINLPNTSPKFYASLLLDKLHAWVSKRYCILLIGRPQATWLITVIPPTLMFWEEICQEDDERRRWQLLLIFHSLWLCRHEWFIAKSMSWVQHYYLVTGKGLWLK